MLTIYLFKYALEFTISQSNFQKKMFGDKGALTPLTKILRAFLCRYNWHSAGFLGWPFPMLIGDYIFQTKIYGSNFIKQHSEIVMVQNCQNADCSFTKIVVYYNVRHTLYSSLFTRR